MTLEDENRLYLVIGPFVGLGEDEEIYKRFLGFDVNDSSAVAAVIEEFLRDGYVALREDERREALRVLRNLATQPAEQLEEVWDSILPPFSYPQTFNLFQLIHDVLTER